MKKKSMAKRSFQRTAVVISILHPYFIEVKVKKDLATKTYNYCHAEDSDFQDLFACSFLKRVIASFACFSWDEIYTFNLAQDILALISFLRVGVHSVICFPEEFSQAQPAVGCYLKVYYSSMFW